MDQDTESENHRLTEKPDVADQHKREAREMVESYADDRPTTTMPGSGGTVSGTAVADWVDDKDQGHVETSVEEGDVEYRNTEEFRKKIDE